MNKNKNQLKKEPFIRDGKPTIYPIIGDMLLFNDMSGVAYLNGNKAEVAEAIAQGSIDGRVISAHEESIADRCYIIPLVDQKGQELSMRGLSRCSSPRLYSCLNPSITIDAVVWEYAK